METPGHVRVLSVFAQILDLWYLTNPNKEPTDEVYSEILKHALVETGGTPEDFEKAKEIIIRIYK